MRKRFRTSAGIALLLALFLSALAPSRAAAGNGSLLRQPASLSCDRPVRIMPLGDSITRGSSSGTPADPQYYISYRRDLYQTLTAGGYSVNFVGSQHNDGAYYTDFDRDHEGWSGQRDDYIAGKIYGWLIKNPADVILLHIGTNDMSTSISDTGAEDVEKILNEIDRYDPEIWVLVARIIDRVPHNANTATFNANVDAMLTARIDAGDKLIKVNMETGAGLVYALYPSGDMNDSLHPYATGYAKMAAKWEEALRGLLPNCACAGGLLALQTGECRRAIFFPVVEDYALP